MRLRALEMQGFKSFPDKTKLTFNDGITAIVGPNGSGKSNISDCVRWVFGEQSSKTLRGAKMEDVIFGGTQLRKPTGFAWVSLIIDNTDRTLAVEQDEVIVTRKLYRSGESEYRINQDMVRLKDIVELFMDTGLGRDGYSIIGQGRIAEIVGAKSTQRREIFEEAAGIAKYRFRKTEAERRLLYAEENLVRLRDILGELEDRVEPLRIQSQKAVQFVAMAEEKKVLEISLWMETMEKLRGQVKEQEDKILLCKNDHDSLENQIRQIDTTLEELAARRQDIDVFIDNSRKRIEELQANLGNSKSDIAVMENNIARNNEAAEEIVRQLNSQGETGTQLDEQIAERAGKIEAVCSEIDRLNGQITQVTALVEQARSLEAEAELRIESLKSQRFEMRQGVSKAQLDSVAAASLIEEIIERTGQLKESSQQKDENLVRLRKELDDATAFIGELQDQIHVLENSRGGYDMKLTSRRQKIATLQNEQKGLDDKAGTLLQRAQVMEDMEKNMEGFGSAIRYVMRQSETGALRGVVGPISTLITAGDEYAVAVEIALGAAMQNVVVENEDSAKQAIQMLAQSKTGRATFLPITSVKGSRLDTRGFEKQNGYIGLASELVRYDARFTGVVDWLLGRIAVTDTLDHAVQMAKANGYKFRIVTLDGQVVNSGGSLTGGYVARSAGILGRKSEIEKLKAQAEEFVEKSRQIEGQIKEEAQQLAALEAAVEGIEAEMQTAKEDLLRAQAEHRRLTLSTEEALQTHKAATREYDTLAARLTELQAQNLSSDEAVASINNQLVEIEKELVVRAKERDDADAEADRQGEAVKELQILLLSQQKDKESLETQLSELRQRQEGHNLQLSDMKERLESYRQQNEEIRAGIEARIAQSGEETQVIDRISQQIEDKTKERLSCEQKDAELNRERRNFSDNMGGISGELGRLEERYKNMMEEMDNIVNKLWEDYEMSRTQALEIAVKLEDLSAAQKRLTDLRGKIKALGNVNVGAIEEYKEVSERYTFLKAQVEDIESSKAELSRIIAELTADMCQLFSDKFTRINDQFSRIFVELFGGGKARLELSDESDVLESGIEIFVQPPGKLIKNLSSLSGGEQAFVAIAIYFAILKVSPAPFCLIDEIEAALDDVNVGKFAAYLRRMTKRTQFIAITHRRGTMEEADVLYGVTMQEEGVSKMLKLDVTEIESKLGIK